MAVFYTIRKRSATVRYYAEEDEQVAISVTEGLNRCYQQQRKTKSSDKSYSPYCCIRRQTNENGEIVGFSIYSASKEAWGDEINVPLMKTRLCAERTRR